MPYGQNAQPSGNVRIFGKNTNGDDVAFPAGANRDEDVAIVGDGSEKTYVHEVTGRDRCLAVLTVPAGATVSYAVYEMPSATELKLSELELTSATVDNSAGGSAVQEPIVLPSFTGTHLLFAITGNDDVTLTIASH